MRATTRFVGAAAVAALVLGGAGAASAASLAAEATTGSIVGSVMYNGAPATGGCAQLFDENQELITSDCDGTGTYSFESVAPGAYYVYFKAFTNTANAWYPVGAAEPSTVTVTAGVETVANAELAQGGTITGTSTQGDRARLFDLYGTNFGDVEIAADGSFTFTHVPAGTYRASVHNNDRGIDQFYRSSLKVTPTEYDFPASGGVWELDLGAFTRSSDGTGHLGGYLNGPKKFTSSTLCAVATREDNYAVISVFCGPRGTQFELEGITVNEDFLFAITDGDEIAGKSGWTTSSKTAWYGNVAKTISSSFYLPGDSWYSLPVYFFTDVDVYTPHFYEIQWMGAAKISEGYADGGYHPKSSILRKHMATFLYKYAGAPSVTLPATNPFTDVKTSDPAYSAMVWMKQQGVTTQTKFDPEGNVTRRQMALFMYRLAGEPTFDVPSKSPFKDVKTNDSGYTAIAWMKSTGISTGYSGGTFRPNSPVTRGDMAAFIYRFSESES